MCILAYATVVTLRFWRCEARADPRKAASVRRFQARENLNESARDVMELTEVPCRFRPHIAIEDR